MQDSHAHPHPLLPEDENSQRILSHLQALSKELGTRVRIKEGKVRLTYGILKSRQSSLYVLFKAEGSIEGNT